jgi:hypothetical protein
MLQVRKQQSFVSQYAGCKHTAFAKKKAVRCGSDVDRNNIIACTMEKEAGKAKSSAGRIQRCAYWAAAGASSSSLTRIISQLVLLENSDAFCAVAGVKLTNSFFLLDPVLIAT